jgi:hypothetical protein
MAIARGARGQEPGIGGWLGRGVGQGGDVAGDQVVGFGVPDGALERQMPHGHGRGKEKIYGSIP